MKINLKGKSFLTLLDFSKDEIRYLLDLAKKLKKEKQKGKTKQRFKGKSLAMIFEKRSTRTRCSFETSFGEEGGNAIFLSTEDIQLGGKESIEDTARVLGRMFDAIEFRGFKQEHLNLLSEHSNIPVYNGLTDEYHPTQILADFLTIEEVLGSLENKNLVFVGDGRNNVAISLMIGCAKMGMNFTAIAPKELFPDEEYIARCLELSQESGSVIKITDDIKAGVKDADVIYTDVWTSMGEESKNEERKKLLKPFQVNSEMMKSTGKDSTIFLHCLPAIRGEEVTEDVIEGDKSFVFDEAENRKHTIKAIMVATL